MKTYTIGYYTLRSGDHTLTTTVMADNRFDAEMKASSKIRAEHKTNGFIIFSIAEAN